MTRFGNDELDVIITGTKSDLEIKIDLENELRDYFHYFSYFKFSIYLHIKILIIIKERPQFYNIDKMSELMIKRIWKKQKKTFEGEKLH
jgi:hypothetical protein